MKFARKKKTPEDYHALAERRGFRWIGPEVPTTKTLTTWECPRGHRWEGIYNNIQQGRHCPKCSRKKTPTDFHILAEMRNIKWLGPEVGGMDIPTEWRCSFDHQWITTYRNILRGDDCPYCINNKGEVSLETAGREVATLSVQFRDHPIMVDQNNMSEIPYDSVQETLSLDWWGKKSIDFLRPFFKQAKYLIRVSTGFFSIRGYSLLKPYLAKKHFDILVGYDERSRQDVKLTLIEEIMDDLSKWHGNRREAVVHLVEKLQANEIRMVDARTRQKDHSKVYIFDSDYVIGGSTNLTQNGLLLNHEGDLAISSEQEPERVNWWCRQYQKYWDADDTEDISQLLLERLLKWLSLYKPWDIYLKTIQVLVPEDKPSPPRDSYKMPVEFQMVVVNRAIRQLNDWRGAMIVASTGLGKTVMATHIAYELFHVHKQILNVMVVAPKSVKNEWRKRLISAGISAEIHTRNVLDLSIDETKNQRVLKELLDALDNIDDKWLVIIDESQHFKNRERGFGGERLSFTRLINVVNDKKCLVLLLTATPYATELDNINHQLLLLPHSNPKKHPHQQAFAGLGPDNLFLNSWKVNRVEDLVNLPVGTVINAPYVAQNFAIQSSDGDYLLFGDKKKYIPKIQVNKVNVPVLLEEEMSNILDQGYFRHQPISFMSRGKWMNSKSSIENEVIVSWGSSPLALMEVIEKTIKEEGGFEVPFIYSLDERQSKLLPIYEKISKIGFSDDEKFKHLYILVKQLRENGRKVLIFSERLATAIYIEKGLRYLMPEIRLANTVKCEGNKHFQKDFQEVYDLMIGFAPRSNTTESGIIPEDRYDVFVTTDAYSEGINLQDASVVIHYDIAWTPDNIVQRAGRILRFWDEPRMVYLYLFAGTYFQSNENKKESLRLESRLRKLISRTREAEKFTEITIIPEDTKQFDTLRGLTTIKIETLGQIRLNNLEDERFEVSPFLIHLTELKKNIMYVKTIPDDITSALYVGRIRKPQMYVLVKYLKKYHWMIYDVGGNKIETIEEDLLLDRIKCAVDTEPAVIDPFEIEEYRKACINIWCEKKKLDDVEKQEVKHICSLYMIPKENNVECLLE